MIHALLNEAGISNRGVSWAEGEPSHADGQPIPVAILADWRVKHAAKQITDAEDDDAAELGKWYERKRRNALTRAKGHAQHAAALARLDAKCDENIQRLLGD